MSICIQEVKDTMKELNERNLICMVLVRALSSHASAEDRANHQLFGKLDDKWCR